MCPLPNDTLYQYTLTSSYQGQLCQNVMFFRTKETSPRNSAEIEVADLGSELTAWFVNNVKAFANVGWSPIQSVCKVMAGDLPYQYIVNFVNQFGAIAGEGLPPHDSALISLYTPFHGKRLHGRLFVPGISEADQNGGVLTGAALTRLTTIGSDLITRYAQGGSNPSPYAWLTCFSRANGVQRNPGPPPHLVYDPLAAIPITRMTARDTIRTQRHRRRA